MENVYGDESRSNSGADGRWSRCYLAGDCVIAVTYHRNVRGTLRQLTLSPRLMRKVLRPTIKS